MVREQLANRIIVAIGSNVEWGLTHVVRCKICAMVEEELERSHGQGSAAKISAGREVAGWYFQQARLAAGDGHDFGFRELLLFSSLGCVCS